MVKSTYDASFSCYGFYFSFDFTSGDIVIDFSVKSAERAYAVYHIY